MENNRIIQSLKPEINKLNLIRLVMAAAYVAVAAAILQIPSNTCAIFLFWLAFGGLIADIAFTVQYKRTVVKKIAGDFCDSRINWPNLNKYNLASSRAFYKFEDSYSMEQCKRKAAFAELKIQTSIGKFRTTVFFGNTYCCRLGFDTGNKVFLYSSRWGRRIDGNYIKLECGAMLDCVTVVGMLNDTIRQIIDSKIAPALMRLSLGDFAAIVDGDRLTIVESDKNNHFDIHVVSNIRKKAIQDSQMLGKIKGNLEILSELADEMGSLKLPPTLHKAPAAAAQATAAAETPETAAQAIPAADMPEADRIDSFMIAPSPEESRKALDKAEKMATTSIIMILLRVLVIGAGAMMFLLIPFGGFALFGIALLAGIKLPQYIYNKIYLKCIANAVFGGKATTQAKGKEATISCGKAQIISKSSGSSVGTTICVKYVMDEALIAARLKSAMQSISKFPAYNIQPCGDGITIFASNIGMRLPDSLFPESATDNRNIRDLFMIRGIIE